MTPAPRAASLPAKSISSDAAQMPALDGLRGIAALLVVTHNLLLLRTPDDALSHVVVAIFDRGWIGVQLFFVLSGFLITGILLDSRRSGRDLLHFFARRVLRIFPLYYATLAVLLLLLPALHLLPATFRRAPGLEIYLWTYLWNWVAPFHPGQQSFPHFWSLAIEEQFYLLWPWLVMARPPRRVVRLCAMIAALALLVRALMLWWPLPDEAVYQFSICRMDALALGGAAAAALREPAWRERIDRARHRLLPSALLVFAMGALCSGGYRIFGAGAQTFGYSALAVAAGLLVMWAAGTGSEQRSVARRLLQQRALRRVGRYSYGLYVLHVPLHLLIGLPLLARWGVAKDPGAGVAIVYMAAGTLVSLVAAMVSYHAFEVHFLRLKRWVPMQQRQHSIRPPCI